MPVQRQLLPLFLVCFLSMAFFLQGCSETQLIAHMVKKIPPDTETTYKIGNPYKIDGRWYAPKETYSHSETGIASWYGPNFHGKHTANGEVYDQYALTAAHRTLQLPSIVRVTNLQNGRSIKVRVNDRGPFSKGRIIDMSKKGAELLGFINQGTARVRVDVLPVESQIVADAAKRGERLSVQQVERLAVTREQIPARPVHVAQKENNFNKQHEPFQSQGSGDVFSGPAVEVKPIEVEKIQGEDVAVIPVQPSAIYVQAGAFSVYNNAYQLAERLKALGPMQLTETIINDQKFYRVRMGPFQRVEEADLMLDRLWNMHGTANARIIIDSEKQTL